MIAAMQIENPKIAKLYRNVPPEQVQKLLHFRANHPCKQVAIGTIDWPYILAGQGKSVILLLPGALATAESAWQSILHFADCYRVLCPSYPPVVTIAELVDGIAGILEEEGLAKAHVVGGSYGGLVAQAFVRRHPGKTDKLVISHAGYPDAGRGAKIAKAMRWLPLLPMGVLRLLAKKRLAGLLPKGHAETAFFRAYVQEVLQFQLTKESFLNTYRRVVDFDRNHRFSPRDLSDWPGKVLLVMADDDPATPDPVPQAMQALYPQAQVHIFSGTGHAAAILKRDEYYSLIEAFLAA